MARMLLSDIVLTAQPPGHDQPKNDDLIKNVVGSSLLDGQDQKNNEASFLANK
jgi:hypothetical protein